MSGGPEGALPVNDGRKAAGPSEAAVPGNFGVSCMVTPLRRVAMRRPGRAIFEADPALWHYAGPLDARKLVHQYDAFVRHVANSGTEIDWIPDAEDGLADSVFVFDPSFMTPWGAILLRPGKKLRRPEVNLHEGFYERQRVPVIGAITPPGLAEGGDLLWLDESTLVVGRGFRTNQAGIDQIRTLLEPRGVQVHAFDLPSWQGRAACLHLLSLISPLDRDLALVYPPLLPVALYQFMRERGIECLEAGDKEFQSSRGLSLNVLALAPRKCVAVAGFPGTLRLMKDAGCQVTCFVANALCIPCEGGPTCMTLPIWRG